MLNVKSVGFWYFPAPAHACDDITVELNTVEIETIIRSGIGILQNTQQ